MLGRGPSSCLRDVDAFSLPVVLTRLLLAARFEDPVREAVLTIVAV